MSTFFKDLVVAEPEYAKITGIYHSFKAINVSANKLLYLKKKLQILSPILNNMSYELVVKRAALCLVYLFMWFNLCAYVYPMAYGSVQ